MKAAAATRPVDAEAKSLASNNMRPQPVAIHRELQHRRAANCQARIFQILRRDFRHFALDAGNHLPRGFLAQLSIVKF